MHFNQELEELLGDFTSPIRQAQPALELNSVWAGCLVTPLVQDGQQITKLNLSVAVDVGAAGHLGGGDDGPITSEILAQPLKVRSMHQLVFKSYKQSGHETLQPDWLGLMQRKPIRFCSTVTSHSKP